MSQGYDLDNITYVMDLEKKATVEAISQESYADSMISHADDYLSTLYVRFHKSKTYFPVPTMSSSPE